MMQVLRRIGRPVWISAVLFCLVPGVAAADPGVPPRFNNNPVVGSVDGDPIRLDDLKTSRIHDAMVQLYKMQGDGLKRKAVELLQKKHPELKSKSTTQVTAEDILRFYKNTPGINEMGSFEKMEDEIRDYLVKVYEANHLERIYQKGLKNGWIENFLTPPNDFTVVIGLGSTMLWFEDEQPPSRKVFVLEYSDFQCPFCKRVQATMTILRNRFADKVQFGYRHFPLPIHKEAQELAEAVECARDQGRFWELQTLIYRNAPRNLDKPHILNFAKQVGVKNLTDFENCWKEGKHKKRVFTDLQDGNQVGVQATPTFIVGIHDPQSATISGEMFSGALSLNQFTRKIEKYISLTEVPPKG